MTLLDRYVQAVQRHLPRQQRDDIAAELRDMLLSQIESAQTERGRTLTDDEIAAMLQRFGHPLEVAARYGSQEYLIGPRVFPYYRTFLTIALTRVALPSVVFIVGVPALLADHPVQSAARGLWILATAVLAGIGLTTLVFARIERYGGLPAELRKWNQQTLTDEEPSGPPARVEAIASLLIMTFWLLCWVGTIPFFGWVRQLNLRLGGAPMGVELGPIWDVMSPYIIALMAGSIAADVVAIARPAVVRLYESASLVLDLGALIVLSVLLRAELLVVGLPDSNPSLVRLFNGLVFFGLAALAILVLLHVASGVRRIYLSAGSARVIGGAGPGLRT